ncbi:pyridoxamine 5'-phosphate oxidase family protein [Phytohabitans suffuscus]|uniref:Uncharacterized protein n=1 Tax=Phytohabitans suffuscus TaxID=624315 RepID=A0A6F8YA98_9ACTN|nr:pyridoxamine 5'-phosphate oxidase family protein [Phytohabitans suffuscus]BCB83026.1 hypothetical protein Psuf_003390 [Phytohabitans suffuscus]
MSVVVERRCSSEAIWRVLGKASFAVLSHVTPSGEPRSSGVVYRLVGHRLYVAVGEDSWKARHIAADGRVAVTVPVRRGGIMSLLLPIPPATISFAAMAAVHPPGPLPAGPIAEQLGPLLPPQRLESTCLVEIEPRGHFVTYGIGVPLTRMRIPDLARARVPVADAGPAVS